MFAIFLRGIFANLVFIFSGLYKQYLIAGYLTVTDFGVYGSVVVLASFLLILIPFPAYLNVLLLGFSPKSNGLSNRIRLTKIVCRELAVLSFLLAISCSFLLFFSLFLYPLDVKITWILLLLLVQYLGACIDIVLRMHKAHSKLAQFMLLRNVPVIALLLIFVPNSVTEVIFIDVFSIALTFTCLVYSYRRLMLRIRLVIFPKFLLDREQIKIWLARLSQFGNSSILRLLVPIIFGAHESGLFFFALIAQLPCSLFLSMTTQIFGHKLADNQLKDWAALLKIQGWFLLPNVLYLIIIGLIMPFWVQITSTVPGIVKYIEAGNLIFPLVLYAAILASDCQEYLLRSRGLSHLLLIFYLTSFIMQLSNIAIGSFFDLELRQQVIYCSIIQCIILALFSFYSFKKVINKNISGALV